MLLPSPGLRPGLSVAGCPLRGGCGRCYPNRPSKLSWAQKYGDSSEEVGGSEREKGERGEGKRGTGKGVARGEWERTREQSPFEGTGEIRSWSAVQGMQGYRPIPEAGA